MSQMNQTLHLIRHGHSLHNELFHKIGVEAFRIPLTIDSPLTNEGHLQSIELGNTWQKKPEIDLVLVSPCLRTLETAKFIFRDIKVPMIAKDFLIEFPLGGEEICNKRKDISDLKYMYPNVFFESKDDKLKWSEKDETINELEIRIKKMIKWIGERPEKNIAIVSHSSFIGQFKDKKIGDELNELRHCFPYEIKMCYNENGDFLNMN